MAHRRREKQRRREEREQAKRAEARAHRTKLVALAGALVVLGAGFAYLAFTSFSGASPSGSPAPDFSLVDSHGNTFRLSQFRGRPVVLFFMTSSDWCLPCKIETRDHLRPLYDTFGDRVQIVSLEMLPEARSDADLNAYAATYGTPWIYAGDTAGVSRSYGVTTLSVVVIVDQNGYIRFRQSDPTFDQMAEV
ncbi:MAG: TlpA family protein disulfide reductase, partial [Euryarchaeota archaeon]|nr:TlpA family protein disulfide reductase [Euryarchaeota archaeon]